MFTLTNIFHSISVKFHTTTGKVHLTANIVSVFHLVNMLIENAFSSYRSWYECCTISIRPIAHERL